MGHDRDHFAARRAAALVSLVVGLALLVVKWAAYALTGSHAILSDALESVVNVAASGFALLSILLGSRPPDPRYPYGYGKVAYVSAGFEGGLIALASCAILYETIQGLVRGEQPRQLGLGLVLLAVASSANLALGLFLVHRGRQTRSLVLTADGRHVLADAYTSLGVLAGVGLVLLTGWSWVDSAVAIVVALHILWIGYGLVREGFVGLLDRADPALLARIVDALQASRRPGWADVHQLRAWQAGDRTFVDFHLVVPEHWTVGQLHDANDVIRAALRAALGPETEVNIHFDPDRPARPGLDARRPWTVAGSVRTPGRPRAGTTEPAALEVEAT
jgi:cation diffusion facilitator family transporter